MVKDKYISTTLHEMVILNSHCNKRDRKLYVQHEIECYRIS